MPPNYMLAVELDMVIKIPTPPTTKLVITFSFIILLL